MGDYPLGRKDSRHNRLSSQLTKFLEDHEIKNKIK